MMFDFYCASSKSSYLLVAALVFAVTHFLVKSESVEKGSKFISAYLSVGVVFLFLLFLLAAALGG